MENGTINVTLAKATTEAIANLAVGETKAFYADGFMARRSAISLSQYVGKKLGREFGTSGDSARGIIYITRKA